MSPIPFRQHNIVMGADQPEYQPLPAHRSDTPAVVVTCCYALTLEEVRELYKRVLSDDPDKPAAIYFSQCTFGAPLQPVAASIDFNPPNI